MKRSLVFTTTGLGLGMGLMYFLDPNRGNRRRRLIRDQAVHLRHQGGKALTQSIRDLSHRTQGMWSNLKSLVDFRKEQPSDDLLTARVRSRIGRVTSHPHAIEVSSNEGRVTLRGSILEQEYDAVIHATQRVQGVQQIQPQLNSYFQAEGVPELQGGRRRKQAALDFMQVRWAPATRFLIGSMGAVSMIYALSRPFRRERVFLQASLMIGGSLMVLRSTTQLQFRQLLGIEKREGFSIHKTMNVQAPIEEVFRFWSKVENYSQFVTRAQEIRDLGEGRSYWRVEGPLGIPLSWIAEVYEISPQQKIAWRSLSDAHVQNSGEVRFYKDEIGGTKIELEFNYYPPLGIFGVAMAKIFRADPRKWIEDSFIQMKQIMEQRPTIEAPTKLSQVVS